MSNRFLAETCSLFSSWTYRYIEWLQFLLVYKCSVSYPQDTTEAVKRRREKHNIKMYLIATCCKLWIGSGNFYCHVVEIGCVNTLYLSSGYLETIHWGEGVPSGPEVKLTATHNLFLKIKMRGALPSLIPRAFVA
jgi:hypothetical protein